MFKIEQLSFSYHQQQNAEMLFDLDAKPGEILSIIGPSGCGKSTLLNLIAGFLPAQSGHISIDNEFIENLSPAQRPLTMVFQQHNLFPHLDLYTNVALGINPSLKLSEEQKNEVSDALKKLGLSGLEKRKPGQLSGGQRQRVALARALVRHHKVLLLDEPFAALGPALRQELIELLKSLVQQKSMIALLVSHQPDDALQASGRTAFIHQGRVCAIDETAKLLNNTDNKDIRSYLGSL
ncbi:MAG: ATP-binding cassette domain-containing protein [Gammaproteobacteria bacterium]|nr:ATP-binding cassette domain-containing protein [Gammaproteobacteria bacterium]